MTGLVTGTIEFSAVDGPGNRFVVFLQGCTFDCLACHNPYTINACNDCGICVESCPTGALSVVGGRVAWNPSVCGGTEECIRICPYDATPKARTLDVGALVDLVRPSAPFLSGVTVSGGEATHQPRFLAAFFSALATDASLRRLTRFVDTNGDAPASTWDLLDPVLDGAMVDLKALDEPSHIRLTGHSNRRVLDSIRLLAARGKLYEVRLLLIPGLNDSDDQLRRTGEWLSSVQPGMRVKAIGYRAHGVRRAGLPLQEPGEGHLAHCADLLASSGDLAVTVV